MNRSLIPCLAVAMLTACGGGSGGESTTATSSSSTSATVSSVSSSVSSATSSSSSVASSSGQSSSASTASISSASTASTSSASGDCANGTYAEKVVCAVSAFEATLTSGQLANTKYTTNANSAAQLNVYKTQWSNLPNATRAGIAYSSLTTTAQREAFFSVAKTALTTAGYAEFTAVLAADDYLGTMRSGYSSDTYHIAIVGTPSTTDLWTLQLGGHHMAYNITFNGGKAYPTPHHIGVEPKASFTVNGASYQALADKAAAMLAIFYGKTDSLSPTTAGTTALTSAYLSGQTFSDILIGPVEYNTGSYTAVAAKFPTSNRGVLVSSLTAAQQELVTTAISKFVSDYDSTTAAELLEAYKAAYSSTYVAWGATSGAKYPNIDADKTYMRIDGPRVWIEISCQAGVVISNATHYHMMYRDKATDYYNQLSTN